MSSLKLLSATTIIHGINSCNIQAKDLVQGSELFLHMLESPDPVCTACGTAAVNQLVAAGDIPMDSCLGPLLQALQLATRSLSSPRSSSEILQSEHYVTATLRHTMAVWGSANMRDHITDGSPGGMAATITVLVDVLQLPSFGWLRPTLGFNPRVSHDDRIRQENTFRTVCEARDVAVSILEGFSRETASKQAFAAAGCDEAWVDGGWHLALMCRGLVLSVRLYYKGNTR
jgi:hypothetical protein